VGNPHGDYGEEKTTKKKEAKALNTLVMSDVNFYPVVEPILEILDAILWPAIAVVVAVGSIYCIFLGVKIAKSDEQNSREKAKKDLLGAIVGFVIIFVLILASEDCRAYSRELGQSPDVTMPKKGGESPCS
jgi:cell division protein FtsW (lipid II flippase)